MGTGSDAVHALGIMDPISNTPMFTFDADQQHLKSRVYLTGLLKRIQGLFYYDRYLTTLYIYSIQLVA